VIAPLIGIALVSALATLGLRRVALHYSIVANPNPIVPQHQDPIAILGGLGVAGGLLFGLVASGYWPGIAIFVGALGMLALGLIDDLKPFSPKRKIVIQSLVAISSVLLGLGSDLTGHILLDHPVAFILVLFWVNAVNLTDVCDGLVSSLVAISMIGIAAIGDFTDPLPLAVAAACLGFLVFNWPPASIYLGDAGSHLLGFLLAALTINGVAASQQVMTSLGIVACSSIFIFELVFLVLIRNSKGLPWWRGSPDHFSLRMQAGPFSRRQTVVLSCLAGVACSGAGWILTQASLPIALAILALFPAAAVLAGRSLLHWSVDGPSRDPR